MMVCRSIARRFLLIARYLQIIFQNSSWTLQSARTSQGYSTIYEQNLLRIVERSSVVEVEYVAQMVGQERQIVEAT
jgi:hypothetical protein